MVGLNLNKQSVIRISVAAFATASAGAVASIHVSALREYELYEQRVKDSDTAEKTDGYVAYAGTTERIQTVFELAERHKGSHVLISGGHADYTKQDILEEFEPDIDPDNVDFMNFAQNTRGNAIETRLWAGNNGLKSITVVTNASHAPRAYLETTQILPENIKLHFHTVGEFPEEGSAERALEAYKLWCVENSICSTFLRGKPAIKEPDFSDMPDEAEHSEQDEPLTLAANALH